MWDYLTVFEGICGIKSIPKNGSLCFNLEMFSHYSEALKRETDVRYCSDRSDGKINCNLRLVSGVSEGSS